MRFLLGSVLLALCWAGQTQAAQYNTINAAGIERLLNGTDQEKAAASFYVGGALDSLSLSNTMLAEQGTPLYCPSAKEDLRPSVITPKLLQHIQGLHRKPRAAQALEQITTSTILLVLLTTDYPCQLDENSNLAPPSP